MRGFKLLIGCMALLVASAGQVQAGMITYSGNGNLYVPSGGPVHDPVGFGVTPYPGLPFEFSVKVNDDPKTVLSLIPGNRIGGISGFDGSITVDGITTAVPHMAIFIYDNFRSGGSLGNPELDQLLFTFRVELNGALIGINYFYNLPSDTYSFSGSPTPPPIFATTVVSQYSEPGFSRDPHRYRFITSPPPGPSSLIPDGHSLTGFAQNAVPEPTSLGIFAIGALGLVAGGRRRLKKKQSA